MGVSTNAIMAWGIDLGEDYPCPDGMEDGEDFDWMEWASQRVGPVTVEPHCSYEYPMHVLHLKSHEAWRGNAVELEPDAMVVEPEWQAQLDAACDALGAERQAGKWLLFSMWG